MCEDTVSEGPATNIPGGGVEQAQERRVPTGPLPSFGDDLPSLELPGIILSAKAILRALHLAR
jgi:hypothetical protein